jgi:hypothetical protein
LRAVDDTTTPAYQNWVAGLIIVSATLWSAWGALHPFSGDTSNSRMATVYGLVHNGTWQIDEPDSVNPFEGGTVDKVKVEGRTYSSKPPVLPLMMTAEYAVLYGLGMHDLRDEADRAAVLKIQTLTFITIPFAVSGILFFLTMRSFRLNAGAKLVGLTALMWGSEYAGYAGTMNNHVPATVCLLGALGLYRMVQDKKNVQTGIMCGIAGMCLGLAVTIDLPSAIFVLVLVIAFIHKFSYRNTLWGIGGALIPIAVHSAIMVSLHGSPLPFQMDHDYYMYEESYWRDPYGVDALNHPWGLYLFNMTIGRVGAFILYPVLAVGGLGLIAGVARKNSDTRLWDTGILVAFLVLMLYYLTGTNNYGGASFGFRWFIIITPFFALALSQLLSRIASKPALTFAWILVGISAASAIQCRLNTWTVNQEWPTRLFGPLV